MRKFKVFSTVLALSMTISISSIITVNAAVEAVDEEFYKELDKLDEEADSILADLKNDLEKIDDITIGDSNGEVSVSLGKKTIFVDGISYEIDVAPYIQASSNSTMVPLRAVSVALGSDTNNSTNSDNSSNISYNSSTKTVTILYENRRIQFQAGSDIMLIDGNSIPMDYGVTAEIYNGRMFVPFRALGQALGVNVSWNAYTRTATFY